MGIYIFIFAVMILVVFIVVYRHKLYYHFREIDPGRLYCSGALSPKALHGICRRYGIRAIVNLVSTKELANDKRYLAEKKFCENNEIKLINISLKRDQPPGEEQMKEFLEKVQDKEYLPLLVHCEAGVMRTNMMVALYMKRCMEVENDKIMEQLNFFGHKIERHKKVTGFIRKVI